jgi:hypothetical protein
MKTLDVARTHDGIVVVSGFGAKAWETAYYVNGKLFAADRETPEDAKALRKLCKKLAKDLGYTWAERFTHIWWRLDSYVDVMPKTLAVYDRETVKAYERYSEEDLQDRAVFISLRPADEMSAVSEVYELSGGLEDEFEDWYRAYLADVGTFNAMHDEKLALYMRLGRTTPDAEYREVQAELEDLTRAYLADVYRAPKPLDAVAKRVLKKVR